MAKQTRNGETAYGRSLERHQGADAVLKVSFEDQQLLNAHIAENHPFVGEGGTYEIPITNVDWTKDFSHEEIQHNGGLEATLTTTEIRYSGSFEYEGQNPQVLNGLSVVAAKDGANVIPNHIPDNRPVRFKMAVTEYNHDNLRSTQSGQLEASGQSVKEQTVIFKRVLISSNDRSISAGDSSTTSFDWSAESMDIYQGGGPSI